ncbi:MAG: hypothetical protein ACYC7F_05405 [Gemmatimonadaceae bacterium]
MLALFASPVAALAQGASVSAVVVSAWHPLIGDRLTGAAVSVSVPQRDKRRTLQYGAERVHGEADRIGIACAGFIRPETCPSEHLRDAVRVSSASVGPSFHLLQRRHTLLALTADLTLASIRADTRGLTSDGRLVATKMLWGGRIGANAAWTPWGRVPVALEIEGGIGRLEPIVHEQVSDGYTPFERGFNLSRFRVGVAWRP